MRSRDRAKTRGSGRPERLPWPRCWRAGRAPRCPRQPFAHDPRADDRSQEQCGSDRLGCDPTSKRESLHSCYIRRHYSPRGAGDSRLHLRPDKSRERTLSRLHGEGQREQAASSLPLYAQLGAEPDGRGLPPGTTSSRDSGIGSLTNSPDRHTPALISQSKSPLFFLLTFPQGATCILWAWDGTTC